jgi:oxygen-independent coproporphyrinogen III oxidase
VAGSDLLATGIASFGHVSGVHYQNLPSGRSTSAHFWSGTELPLGRAMRPTPHQLLVREMILQLKRGRLGSGYFRNKFGVDIVDEWRTIWRTYRGRRLVLTIDTATIGSS